MFKSLFFHLINATQILKSCGQAFEILTEIRFEKLFLDLHDNNCLNMCFVSVIILVFFGDMC